MRMTILVYPLHPFHDHTCSCSCNLKLHRQFAGTSTISSLGFNAHTNRTWTTCLDCLTSEATKPPTELDSLNRRLSPFSVRFLLALKLLHQGVVGFTVTIPTEQGRALLAPAIAVISTTSRKHTRPDVPEIIVTASHLKGLKGFS